MIKTIKREREREERGGGRRVRGEEGGGARGLLLGLDGDLFFRELDLDVALLLAALLLLNRTI
jgi:hypothetical protein